MNFMTKKFTKTALLLLLMLFSYSASAVPAYPYPVKITQPDGTTLTVILRGDEFFRYHVTEDGLLLTKNSRGIFNYARLKSDSSLEDTGVKASDLSQRSATEQSFVKELAPGFDLKVQRGQMRSSKVSPAPSLPAAARFPKTGSPRSLVILVNFSDLSFVTPGPATAFRNMLNQEGYSANGATGSARDYFRDNSMNTFSPQFDVVGPFTLPQTFKFYGENSGDFDKNPVQMVVDACSLASTAGVDFSMYDSDNNNVVDNVFIYYAGHNEAEWADENTVWPHRWAVYPKDLYGNGGNYTGTVASVTFNGKRVMDYACTSELRGSSGSNMAGIGTFTHEFGHVIGLADMYPTNNYEHFTLSYWNIMDAGAYLNEGRTPPAYNAFERFQLGFLTPELLTGENTGKTLEPLTSGNRAYLISASDYHNLNGSNPDPKEFFLLENRQKTSWDAFLPGHGMLIYRINYNPSDWGNNVPNNDPAKMGVQLMPADGKASESTLSGDPFPGTSGVTSFDLISRAGTPFNKGVRGVSENNGNITFSILTPLGIPIVPTDANTITKSETGFHAAWNPVTGANSYLIDVYTKTAGGGTQSVLAENFSKFTAGQPNGSADGVDISPNLDNFTGVYGWNGNNVFQAGGSVKVGSSGSLGYLAAPALDLSADGGKYTLKFDAMAWNGDDKLMKILINSQLKHTVTDLNNTTYSFKSYSIPFTGGAASTSIKFEGNKAANGRFFLDNIEITQVVESVKVPVAASPYSATGSTFLIDNLEPGKTYFYSVKAVNDAQVSASSLEVGPITLLQSGLEEVAPDPLKIWSANKVIFFRAEENENVEIINLSGQKIFVSKSVTGINQIHVQLSGVVIVKVGNRIGKVIL